MFRSLSVVRRGVLAVALAAGLVQCGRATEFIYHLKSQQTEPQLVRRKVKEMNGTDKLDVLWVIDNSGSMSDHQKAVIANTKEFMDAFTTKKHLDWKMGLVSTHTGDQPFIGFNTTDALDKTSKDPVGDFQKAVARLGLNKGCPELVFEPVMNHLTAFPTFSRNRAILTIIALTDTMEEGPGLQAQFEKYLIAAKNDLKYVRFYGTFAGQSFGCPSSEPPWLYPKSPFEYFINLTGGKVFSLCGKDFGKDLAKVGEEIASSVTYSKFLLKDRPLSETLKVSYKGKELTGGTARDGLWYYDFDANAVTFYNLDFTADDEDEIEITYDRLKPEAQ
jgi:hypothetical protein